MSVRANANVESASTMTGIQFSCHDDDVAEMIWISEAPRGVERFFLLIPTQTLRRNYSGFETREYIPKRREISPRVGKISIDSETVVN